MGGVVGLYKHVWRYVFCKVCEFDVCHWFI